MCASGVQTVVAGAAPTTTLPVIALWCMAQKYGTVPAVENVWENWNPAA